MAKQLILLAGLHKTGTTSIQLTCGHNREALREANFHYPVDIAGKEDRGNHTALLNALFRRDPLQAGLTGRWQMAFPASIQAVYAKVRAAATPRLEAVDGNLILAAEGVSLFSVEELDALKQWFAARGWDIRVICHVRHLSSWMNSMIAQRVCSPMRLSIPAAINEFREYGAIVRPRIENLKAAFPETIFRSHEQAVQHRGGPPGAFFESAGISLPGKVEVVRANEGRSMCAARTLSLIFERFGRFDDSGKSNPDAFADKTLNVIAEIPGPKFALRQSEVEPLAAMLRAENEWLRQTLGEAFFDPRLEFGNPGCEWSAENLGRLTGAVNAMPPTVKSWVQANLQQLDLDPDALAGA